ncbi:MAG: glycosyltransferase family 87 protein [Candidatus Sedimenticola sp. (ex Thyasira tokunagai)]
MPMGVFMRRQGGKDWLPLSPWLLYRLPYAVIAGVLIGFLVTLFTVEGATTLVGRLGGDYPAFYGAGRIIATGDWENLYDLGRQAGEQKPLLGAGQVLYFAYPPFAALPFGLLAELEYRWSYLLYTLILFASLLLATHLLRSLSSYVKAHYWPVVGWMLLFYPLLKAVGGGQNSAITLLLLIGSWWGVTHGRPYLSGLLIGLLLYKPHFALPMMLLFLIAGHWRVAAASVATALCLYGISAWMMGGDWLFQWSEQVLRFAAEDAGANAFQNISWYGLLAGLFGVGISVTIAGIACSVMTFIYLGWKWWQLRDGDMDLRMALAAPGVVLITPHTMFYDGSLILISLVVLIDRCAPHMGLRMLLVFLAGIGHYFAPAIGFSTVFFAVLATAWWSINATASQRSCAVLGGAGSDGE